MSLFQDPKPAPAPILLRPYQGRMVGAWQAFKDKGGQRGLIVAATGTGKTTVVAEIVRSEMEADPGFTCLSLAHRRELLEQMSERVALMAPLMRPTVHCGGSRAMKGSRFVAASAQSIGLGASDALSWLGPDLVVADEAHHAPSRSWQNVFSRFGCYDEFGTRLLGVTATPHRLDNAALVDGNNAKGKATNGIFEEIVFRYDIRDAVREGFLVDLRGYRAAAEIDLSKVKTKAGDYDQGQLERAMNVDAVNELALESWFKAADGRKTIVFCAGVDHAKAVADAFRLKDVPAEAIYGEMKREERAAAIERFRRGETRVLTNMDVLTEGFDSQDCGAIVLLRPTKSWSLFTQMIGRGLRVLPGVIEGCDDTMLRRARIMGSAKPDCVIIDIVGLTAAQKVDTSSDGTGETSLNGLVGLPEQLDLEGRTISEALDAFEEMPEAVKAAAYRRPTKFSELTAVLTQVEMLAEVEVPPEVIDADAEFYWIRSGEATYTVDCGNEPGGYARHATLTLDLLGRATLRLTSSGGRDESHVLPGSLPIVLKAAEGIIERTFFGVARLASRKALWRQGNPTEQQIQFLRERGIHEEVLKLTSKGSAAAMIGMLKRTENERGQA